MKIEESYLSVAADLSEASYESALEELGLLVNSLEQKPTYFKDLGVVLVCGYFECDTALAIMAKYRNCNLRIVRCYSEEWHVEFTPIGSDTTYKIFSPGA